MFRHWLCSDILYGQTLGMFRHCVCSDIGYVKTWGMYWHWVCSSVGRISNFWTNEHPNIFVTIDKLISEYIRHDKISPMNIRINSPVENQWIFLRMDIFVQNILMYSNIRWFFQDCFGLFCPFSNFVLFDPHWTILDQ